MGIDKSTRKEHIGRICWGKKQGGERRGESYHHQASGLRKSIYAGGYRVLSATLSHLNQPISLALASGRDSRKTYTLPHSVLRGSSRQASYAKRDISIAGSVAASGARRVAGVQVLVLQENTKRRIMRDNFFFLTSFSRFDIQILW